MKYYEIEADTFMIKIVGDNRELVKDMYWFNLVEYWYENSNGYILWIYYLEFSDWEIATILDMLERHGFKPKRY